MPRLGALAVLLAASACAQAPAPLPKPPPEEVVHHTVGPVSQAAMDACRQTADPAADRHAFVVCVLKRQLAYLNAHPGALVGQAPLSTQSMPPPGAPLNSPATVPRVIMDTCRESADPAIDRRAFVICRIQRTLAYLSAHPEVLAGPAPSGRSRKPPPSEIQPYEPPAPAPQYVVAPPVYVPQVPGPDWLGLLDLGARLLTARPPAPVFTNCTQLGFITRCITN